MSATQKPVAWMFVQPDGRVRFILHDKARADAWATAHAGEIVPLYRAPTLTDAERSAVNRAASAYADYYDDPELMQIAATLRGLLERTK